MPVKKIDDSRVDEMVKKSEARHAVSGAATPQQNSGQVKKIVPKINIGIKPILEQRKKEIKETASLAVIVLLLALALIQSVELINLRQQIKSGQFGGANTGSSGNTQGLPSQQGGC